MLLRRVIEGLPRFSYRFYSEVDLHEGIATVLSGASIPFEREFVAGPKDRFDFLIPGGIVIEAKTKGSLSPALSQCARYLKRPDVSTVVLVTTRFWGLSRAASQYNSRDGKVVHVVRLRGASF